MSNRNKNRPGNNNRGNLEEDYLKKMAIRFADLDFKAYKKQFKKKKDDSIGNKKIMKMYYNELIDMMPDVADWVQFYGYRRDRDTMDLTNRIFNRVIDPGFMKRLYKSIRNGMKFKNEKDLPMFMREALSRAAAYNRKTKSDKDAIQLDISLMEDITKHFMRNRLEKLTEEGKISEMVAFNALMVIPYPELMCQDNRRINGKYIRGTHFRTRLFFQLMYDAARTQDIPFADLMKYLLDDDGDCYKPFIIYSLLERKEMYQNLTDSQKEFYRKVTEWAFSTLEQYERDSIIEILSQYIKERRIAENAGKDGNRRYALSSLVETDYPKIVKAIKFMIVNDESIKKYL